MGLGLGALLGGGVAALQKKDFVQGALMGGVGGALGGILMPAAGAAGAAAGEGVNAATQVATQGVTDGVTGAISSGGIAAPTAAGSGGIGSFLGANQGALMGGGLGGMMASAKNPKQRSEGNIYDMSFSQEQNPLFGQPGQAAFTNQGYKTNSITPVEDYKPTMTAANGGIIALAEGGGLETQRYERPVRQVDPAVTAYNAKLMERANQQYNVNLPPAPNQVPGSAGYIAPTAPQAPVASTTASTNSISGLTFNPVTQQYEGAYAAPGAEKKNSDMFGNGMYRDRYYDYSNSGGGPDGPNGPDSPDDGSAAAGAAANANSEDGPGSGPGNGPGAGGDFAYGGLTRYNQGGISSLGSYSDGGQLLRGPGDGVSDSIPAQIGRRQPARLADGEFVVPARVVSELGNGSTDAGAKQLYAMMDRVQKNRKKTVGKGKVAVDAKSRKLLPA
jgi:hypothetical protein